MRSIAIVTGYIAVVTLLLTLCAQAANAAKATSGSQSQAAATGINRGVNQGITFNSRAPDTRTVYATTPAYAPQSAFGFSPSNCGASDTASMGTPWVSIGGSDAHGLVGCNAREDTKIIWKMGMHKVAKVRFFCFGLTANRKAYEAMGGTCPVEPDADENERSAPPAFSVYGG